MNILRHPHKWEIVSYMKLGRGIPISSPKKTTMWHIIVAFKTSWKYQENNSGIPIHLLIIDGGVLKRGSNDQPESQSVTESEILTKPQKDMKSKISKNNTFHLSWWPMRTNE